MKYAARLLRGTLMRRYKRFLSDILLDSGEQIVAHCPNPGSMLGCAAPGSAVCVSEAASAKRKLRYTWELTRTISSWVGVNPVRANNIAEEAIRAGSIRELCRFQHLQREVRLGPGSRIDFLLQQDGVEHYIEVKSVTLVENQVAMFPDAVTKRGVKHLKVLMQAPAGGKKASMLFLVQREDAECFAPATHIDHIYGETVAAARAAGVQILVYDCRVGPEGIFVRRHLPWNV